ncbi:hypothetical protein GCM10009799_48880 [Nocardiopsis rhodophaea]|uniref:GtrA family protein n=1 Tax=Nocardiopsis rhodophaea TaxID=280238 RepID=A0ABP5F294_9ACTN
MGTTVGILGLDSPLARNISGNFIGVGLATLFRFWSYRLWVFPAEAAVHATRAEEPARETVARG